jgi:histidyl-tRNA synthetase
MSEKKEPARPEARLPKGLFDTSAAEIRATERMLATIRQVFESYGFEPLDTPAIEYTDALGKFLPDQDRPNEGVFSFKDADDGEWLSLRYDLTAPLARYVAATSPKNSKPYLRRYQFGPVWRNEKPGPGRYRQFTQFDADTVGASSVAADAELCMLAADTLEALGVPRGQYVVKFNSRRILDGVLEAINLGGDENAGRRLIVLRAMDKLDKLGPLGVRQLLGVGRKDESGDFTKGANLPSIANNAVVSSITLLKPWFFERERRLERAHRFFSRGWRKPFTVKVYKQYLTEILDTKQLPQATEDGLMELEEMRKLLRAAGYDSKQIRIDPSVVRGLEYYTGPVFEAELLAPMKDERGQPIRLGSVVSGGRYDGLVERFTGEKVPATGISIGVSRLLFGLKTLGKLDGDTMRGPVVVLVLDRDRMADYQRLVKTLRDAGIRAELYLGESDKMRDQLKYAGKRGSPCVVIQGTTERDQPDGPQVTLKDLALGATLTSIKDRDEYLKQQAEAQFAVPEADLVAAVRKVIDRQVPKASQS